MAKTIKTTEATEEITPILEGKYEIVNYPICKVSTGFGIFDLANLTEEQAEKLIKKKVSFIRKVS